VVAWDDDGTPLVLSEQHKMAQKLMPATHSTNFSHVSEDDDLVVAAVPGGGWRVEYEGSGDNGPFSEPVIAWLIRADGDAYPTTSDSDGYATNPQIDQQFQEGLSPRRRGAAKDGRAALATQRTTGALGRQGRGGAEPSIGTDGDSRRTLRGS
jgi:hypothetical protein